MNKTKIEWTDYSWSPITGCTRGCTYCYARKLARGRLRKLYLSNPNVAPGCDPGDPFSPRFWPGRAAKVILAKKPRKIFVCDMGDLFDPHIPYNWIETVLSLVRLRPRLTFQFLTKQPKRAAQFAFPLNAWVGVTINDDCQESQITAIRLKAVSAPVRFFSIEPLLGPIPTLPAWVNWAIIGAMTGSAELVLEHSLLYPGTRPMKHNGKWTLQPHPDWVDALLSKADHRGIPVFLKDNLDWPQRRTEWPKGIKP